MNKQWGLYCIFLCFILHIYHYIYIAYIQYTIYVLSSLFREQKNIWFFFEYFCFVLFVWGLGRCVVSLCSASFVVKFYCFFFSGLLWTPVHLIFYFFFVLFSSADPSVGGDVRALKVIWYSQKRHWRVAGMH